MAKGLESLTADEAYKLWYGEEEQQLPDVSADSATPRNASLRQILEHTPMSWDELKVRGCLPELSALITSKAVTVWDFLEEIPLYYVQGKGDQTTLAEWKIHDRLIRNLEIHSPEEIIIEAVTKAPPRATFKTILKFINAKSPLSWYGMMHHLIEAGRIPLSEKEKEAIEEAKVHPLTQNDIEDLGVAGLLKKGILMDIDGEIVYSYCAGLLDFFKRQKVLETLLSADVSNKNYELNLDQKNGKLLEHWHILEKSPNTTGNPTYRLTILGRKLIGNMQSCNFVVVDSEKRKALFLEKYAKIIQTKYDIADDELSDIVNAYRISGKLKDLGITVDTSILANRISEINSAGVKLKQKRALALFKVSPESVDAIVDTIYKSGKIKDAFSICGAVGYEQILKLGSRIPNSASYVIEAKLSELLHRGGYSSVRSLLSDSDLRMRDKLRRFKYESDADYENRINNFTVRRSKTLGRKVMQRLSDVCLKTVFDAAYDTAAGRLKQHYAFIPQN